eukprot:scaffold62604_cov68-Phaeocystis_antarctica.AAC.2
MSARGKGTRGEGLARVGVAWGGEEGSAQAPRRRISAPPPLPSGRPPPHLRCRIRRHARRIVRTGGRTHICPHRVAGGFLRPECPCFGSARVAQLLRVVEVVKVGVGRLRGDLLRDTHVHEGIEGLLLGDHSGRVGDKVAVAHQGTHDGASDASPIRIGFNREGGCRWRRRWRR